MSVADGYKAWKENGREHCDRHFIVAAQGGGHFAAYHQATFMAQMQDRSDGKFASCVFAISGVSGGSVGAGVFAAAMDHLEQNPVADRDDDAQKAGDADERGEYEKIVDATLRRDLLSPLGARFFFSDLLGNCDSLERI